MIWLEGIPPIELILSLQKKKKNWAHSLSLKWSLNIEWHRFILGLYEQVQSATQENGQKVQGQFLPQLLSIAVNKLSFIE